METHLCVGGASRSQVCLFKFLALPGKAVRDSSFTGQDDIQV
jgi:hypothetical protein